MLKKTGKAGFYVKSKDLLPGSSGKVSSALLILGVILFIVIVIVFVVTKINAGKSANNSNTQTPVSNEPPPPVYEAIISDVKFVFVSAQDLGNFLKNKNSFQQDLSTTEKFIKVTIGAQNKGKVNVSGNLWDVGNIVDSEGRNFVAIDDFSHSFLPKPNLCGELLKPEFKPVPCVKLYEVSKASFGLKVEVNFLGSNSSKKQKAFIDLIVAQ